MEHKFVWPKRLTLNWKKLICWSYDNMCHKVTTYSRLKTIENLLKERFCYYSLDVSTKFLLTCMQVACFIYLPLDGKTFFCYTLEFLNFVLISCGIFSNLKKISHTMWQWTKNFQQLSPTEKSSLFFSNTKRHKLARKRVLYMWQADKTFIKTNSNFVFGYSTRPLFPFDFLFFSLTVFLTERNFPSPRTPFGSSFYGSLLNELFFLPSHFWTHSPFSSGEGKTPLFGTLAVSRGKIWRTKMWHIHREARI